MKPDGLVFRLLYPERVFDRPRTRAECKDGIRPCPFVGCKHNLFLDVTSTGAIKFNYGSVPPWQMAHSCALDAADEGGMTLDEVGKLFGITRERVRQIENRLIDEIRRQNDDFEEPAAPVGESRFW